MPTLISELIIVFISFDEFSVTNNYFKLKFIAVISMDNNYL